MKAATQRPREATCLSIISIHAAREGGDWNEDGFRSRAIISIHAAREGGDLVVFAREPMIDISIHAAREGGDVCNGRSVRNYPLFQSTPPVKAATSWQNNPIPSRLFQSTPPVKAATVQSAH